MTTRIREWVESPLVQGEDEKITYLLDISQWGSNPTGIVVVVKDAAGTDVTGTVTTGSPSAYSDTIIELPAIHSLTAGVQYRVEIKFTLGDNTLETYGFILAEV